ncbi:hypothetical protein LRAMOSA03987 [Lichtheimia ramosa]|uniref:Methyltransferase domain-containing protein n=1 Tax=Lichtheimia ramosa TaxID=688394 RepID=A0A077WWY0_9FUNG|nr:hypothetical protein LRAMOSA03987 [Lichtheimia ramosa]
MSIKQQQTQQHHLHRYRYALVPLCMGMANLALSEIKLLEPFYAQYKWAHAVMLSLIGSIVSLFLGWDHVKTPLMFMYSCFFKPLGSYGDIQSRLESFYQGQAHIYDDSRGKLLRGRKSMLQLCAAQLKEQIANGVTSTKPIWIDLGGGTGWNIEQMNESFPIENFDKVILVDLTPSLCKVAEERFKRRGWDNVIVLCQDAATFETPFPADGHVGLVTMSYSLSMMDHYYPVVDRVQSLLAPDGIFGVVDFYVSDKTAAPAEKWTPQYNRQCNWFTRVFWKLWFEFDHIHLEPGRRDYLEYKFGTIKSVNRRNHFIIPYLIQIPFYVWIGCTNARTDDDGGILATRLSNDMSSGLITPPSPTSVKSDHTMPLSTTRRPLRQWRLDYDPTLPCHTQFRSYIYAFTWEDPRVDLEYMNLSKDDVMLVITSAGDNALEYAIAAQPKRIHCVDMNPCQNHLLELKLASIVSLPYHDFWRMFGDGYHPQFAGLLHDKVSPHLSSFAFQYWSTHSNRFAHKFYKTGYSGLALGLFEWWTRAHGITQHVEALCHADSLEEQERIWQQHVRPVLLSPLIRKVMDNPMFMWNALGVPMNQMKMFLQECTTQEYIENTLDPIASRSLFRNDQYFYYLCMMQSYTRQSCPTYLTREGFDILKSTNALDAFRLHTNSILSTLQELPSNYLTRLVVMDHMDWFDPEDATGELEMEIQEMARTLKQGGRVFWRSAGTHPWYNRLFEKHGFTVQPLAIRKPGESIDRVNMYASFYHAILTHDKQTPTASSSSSTTHSYT